MYVFTDVYMRIHIGVDLGEAVELWKLYWCMHDICVMHTSIHGCITSVYYSVHTCMYYTDICMTHMYVLYVCIILLCMTYTCMYYLYVLFCAYKYVLHWYIHDIHVCVMCMYYTVHTCMYYTDIYMIYMYALWVCIILLCMTCMYVLQPIAFGVSFHLNLQSQSPWSLINRTWQKRPRELDHGLRFEIEEMTLQMR